MRPLAVAVALLVLAGGAPPSHAVQEPAASFTLPEIREGDRADYAGVHSLTLQVGTAGPVLDKRLRDVTAVPVTVSAGTVEVLRLSTATGRAERMDQSCPVLQGGTCLPWIEVDWSTQGMPGLLGATFLAGRAFAVGDAWDAAGECDACVGTPRVEVLAPQADSPPGTAYVVKVTARYRTPYYQWLYGDATLAMDASSPYPLQADLPGGTLRLVQLVRGGAPFPLGGAAPAYPPPPLRAPYVDGLPPEGVPLDGMPSWLEARRFTQRTGSSPPDAALAPVASLRFDVLEQTLRLFFPVAYETVTGQQLLWSVRTARPEGDDETRYAASIALPGVPRPDLPRTWSAATSPAAGTAPLPCATSAVPLWDGVRLALAADLLHAFRGLALSDECASLELRVFGETYDNLVENVTVDAETGSLLLAFVRSD